MLCSFNKTRHRFRDNDPLKEAKVVMSEALANQYSRNSSQHGRFPITYRTVSPGLYYKH